MTIAVQDSVITWRKAMNALLAFKPSSQAVGKALKSYLAQQGSNPDLLIVGHGLLDDTETVIAAEACKLYAWFLRKANTATATFSKATDSATTSSDASSEFRILSNIAKAETPLVFPQAVAFANGITLQGNTTAGGGTTSGANACQGFMIIGLP